MTGSTDGGMLEGLLRGQSGLFPAACVQEVRLRNPDALRRHQHAISKVNEVSSAAGRVAGRREQTQQQQRPKTDQELFEEAMMSKAKL